MQRALRANKHSVRLWTAYFHLELVCVMRVLGRRLVLGLQSLPDMSAISAGSSRRSPLAASHRQCR